MYRSYNVEIGLEEDSITYLYEIFFTATDSSSRSKYETVSLDTFVFLLKEDLKVLPEDKRQVFFYIHGMMGGQRMNFRMTKEDLRDRYISNENSDIGRLITFRWPGNKPAYQADKANVFVVAESMSFMMQNIISSVQDAKLGGTEKVEFDMMSHSLGCELFKEMVFYFKEERKYFDQILLCAPDLDVDVFVKEGPLYSLHNYANRVTTYHSNKDLTLGFSRKLNEKGRLGIDGPHDESYDHASYIFVDMTQVSDEKFFPMKLTGHAYYRGSDIASADMLSTMLGQEAQEIPLRVKRKKAPGSHYKVVPAEEDNE